MRAHGTASRGRLRQRTSVPSRPWPPAPDLKREISRKPHNPGNLRYLAKNLDNSLKAAIARFPLLDILWGSLTENCET